MNVAVRQPRRMGVAEFVERIRPYPDEERWELLDGFPVLMAPQTERHQRIVMNLLRVLDRKVDRTGCVVLPGLGLLNDANDDYAPIPDVVVRCGPMVSGGYAKDPVLVAEVLSPSTMNNDRGRKLDFYTTIPSLETSLIVYQDEVRVEAWRRAGDDWQRDVKRDRGDAVEVGQFGSLTLAEIYQDLPGL